MTRRDLGWLWHGLAGLGIGGVAVLCGRLGGAPIWSPALVVPLLAALGYARESWQHDHALRAHHHLEALMWPAGGLVACAGLLL